VQQHDGRSGTARTAFAQGDLRARRQPEQALGKARLQQRDLLRQGCGRSGAQGVSRLSA
jgi:hypothetical protein